MAVSYSLDLSSEHSVMRRKLLQSEWYQRLWGARFQMSDDRNQVGQFMNDRGGQMIATSVGSTAWGRGCDTAILDDPLSADQALSVDGRTKVNNWIDTTLRSRLNDPATGAIILVMQRLHEIDPTGFLLEQEPGIWTHIRVPLVAEEDERWVFPISGRVFQRKCGETLQPGRFTPEVVEGLRSRRLVFAAQSQQRPAPAEGNFIKRSEVRYYGGIDPKTGQADEKLPENFDLKVISVDCAFKDLATSDFVAIIVIGIKGRKRFVLNVVNQHLDAAATEAEIRRQREVHRPISAVLVEDKANGSAVIQRLKLNVPGVIQINPQGGKIGRMHAVAGEWQAEDWFVDRNAAWTEPLIDQLMMFPNGRNDDMCDSISQAACWLSQRVVPTVRMYYAFTGNPIPGCPY
jgi:predicted phage terminase large subunit-like protein